MFFSIKFNLHFSFCSLFAAASGAKKVLAFEVSKMMCDVAISVISEYNFESNIILLNKMSTDHVSKADDAKLVFESSHCVTLYQILVSLCCMK